MTPMAQLPLNSDAIASDLHDGPFIEVLTRCPSIRGRKRVRPGLDISGRGIVKPGYEVFFLRTPQKVTGLLCRR
jgi:hypothetical protein